jgi:hypothetical protein
MQLVQQIAFILLSAIAIWLFSRNVMQVRKNILLGKDEDYSDQPGLRWKNLLSGKRGYKCRQSEGAVRNFRLSIFVLLNTKPWATIVCIRKFKSRRHKLTVEWLFVLVILCRLWMPSSNLATANADFGQRSKSSSRRSIR